MNYKNVNKLRFSGASIQKGLGGITLAFFLLFLSGCAAKKKTDLQNLSLHGKVKQMIELQYLAVEKFGKAEKGDLYREDGWDLIMNFNEDGYYSKIEYLDSYGNEVGYTDYLYNSDNELFTEQNYDAAGGFSDKKVFSYDDKKRVTQIVGFNNADGLSGSILIEYNEKENLIVEASYNFRGKLLGKEVRKVDKNGFPVETKIYNGEEKLINYRKEKFDKNGSREELSVLSPDGEVLMRVFFKYDKNENLISQEGTDEAGEAFLPIRYEYEFDKQGNWTKRVEYVGDKPTSLLERQFEYYE